MDDRHLPTLDLSGEARAAHMEPAPHPTDADTIAAMIELAPWRSNSRGTLHRNAIIEHVVSIAKEHQVPLGDKAKEGLYTAAAQIVRLDWVQEQFGLDVCTIARSDSARTPRPTATSADRGVLDGFVLLLASFAMPIVVLANQARRASWAGVADLLRDGIPVAGAGTDGRCAGVSAHVYRSVRDRTHAGGFAQSDVIAAAVAELLAEGGPAAALERLHSVTADSLAALVAVADGCRATHLRRKVLPDLRLAQDLAVVTHTIEVLGQRSASSPRRARHESLDKTFALDSWEDCIAMERAGRVHLCLGAVPEYDQEQIVELAMCRLDQARHEGMATISVAQWYRLVDEVKKDSILSCSLRRAAAGSDDPAPELGIEARDRALETNERHREQSARKASSRLFAATAHAVLRDRDDVAGELAAMLLADATTLIEAIATSPTRSVDSHLELWLDQIAASQRADLSALPQRGRLALVKRQLVDLLVLLPR